MGRVLAPPRAGLSVGVLVARGFGFILLLLGLVLQPLLADDPDREVVMIANVGVGVDSLPRNVARAIFAMRQRTWPDGRAVRVFVLPDAHSVHARFAKERLEVFPHQLQLSWDRVVFSGTGQAPERVLSLSEMLERVADTPGGLGYIERGYVDERVRIVTLEH